MKHTIFSLILFFISTSTFATRKEILLNENWMFRFSHQVQFKSEERVNQMCIRDSVSIRVASKPSLFRMK